MLSDKQVSLIMSLILIVVVFTALWGPIMTAQQGMDPDVPLGAPPPLYPFLFLMFCIVLFSMFLCELIHTEKKDSEEVNK